MSKKYDDKTSDAIIYDPFHNYYTSHGSNHYFAEGFYYTYDRGTPEYVFICPHCKKETRYSIDIHRLKD